MNSDDSEPRIDALLAAIGGRADDELARTSARSRSRRRWLSQQAAESTTLSGVLLSRAERDEVVTIAAAAATFCGRLNLVTTRLCLLDLAGRQSAVALIPTAAITSVAAVESRAISGREHSLADDRIPAADTDLGMVLAALAADHPTITLHLNDGTQVSGTLGDVGHDVLALRQPPAVLHVPLAAIAACVLT